MLGDTTTTHLLFLFVPTAKPDGAKAVKCLTTLILTQVPEWGYGGFWSIRLREFRKNEMFNAWEGITTPSTFGVNWFVNNPTRTTTVLVKYCFTHSSIRTPPQGVSIP